MCEFTVDGTQDFSAIRRQVFSGEFTSKTQNEPQRRSEASLWDEER
jgi:hypothetical protein